MRWATYRSDGAPTSRPRVGLVDGDRILGLRSVENLIDLLADDQRMAKARDEALRDPYETVGLDVRLLPPIPTPPSIRDFMAFEGHILPIVQANGRELDSAWYEIPCFYFTNPAAAIGCRDDVPAAPGAIELDFELEVAAVIGKPGADIAPQDAETHIAGYVLMCDWSARDLQRRERGVGLGPVKGKDWATSFGPYLVTPDELEPLRSRNAFALHMTAKVNNIPYSDSSFDEIYWSFSEMIAYASRGTELRTGDILGSGTIATGCIAELAARLGSDRYPWLEPGDSFSCTADPLGSIDCRLLPAVPVIQLRVDAG
jgi:2-keto-4-pentenoate hydratase/2-oxohepta-3-ene-1,7-dioic acid hydratase in catechol pathway